MDAFAAREVSPLLPDGGRDVSSVPPDAPVSADLAPALLDAPRDVAPALPDAPLDVAPALPDASNEVQSASPDASAFCSGETSHMVVNGIESYPVVSGSVLPLSCCEGGELQAVTDTFAWTITVMWSNAGFVLPATLDLANLPRGWSVEVSIGCPLAPTPCISPPDGYASGLTGTLQVSGAIVNYDMSLCLSLAEPPGSPHPLVHTLDLYVPRVHAGN